MNKDWADARSSSRPELFVGQPVLVQHWLTMRWDLEAVVLEKKKSRSYLIEAENPKPSVTSIAEQLPSPKNNPQAK